MGLTRNTCQGGCRNTLGGCSRGKQCFCRGRAVPRLKFGLVWDPAGWEPRCALLLGGTLFPRRPPRWTETHSPAGPSTSLPTLKHIPIPLQFPGWAARLAVTQAAFGRTSNCPCFTPAASASPPRLPAGMTAADQIPSALAVAPRKPGLAVLHVIALVPKQGPCRRARIGIAASGRNFQPLTLISSWAS